jgi:hypothetical protein
MSQTDATVHPSQVVLNGEGKPIRRVVVMKAETDFEKVKSGGTVNEVLFDDVKPYAKEVQL